MSQLQEISQKQINKLGKKFRDSIWSDEDFNFLEEFKKSYDQLLINNSSIISQKLNKNLQNFILVGRLKRTKSIIIKIQRKNNYGMDLTRMSDIAGLRVIVNNLSNQNKAIEIIKSVLNIDKIYDYRKSEQNYRSVHLITKIEDKYLEIQVRTIAQQTWADESEDFGSMLNRVFILTKLEII